mgnify:CR=1 FL=1
MNQKSTSAPIAENKMGTMPVGKLVLNMSLPMMISMLVQALYNIVDSVFVAMLSENALTAVSMAFPLQTLLIAVGAGTGVGMNALLSKSLGEKDFKKADRTASNAAFLYGLSYLVFLILGFTVVKPFYASQVHNADPEILKFGIEYLSTVMIFSFGLLGQFFFERLLTSTGKTIFSMTSQLCGAITNIILDPIFIFGWFGLPAMGVKGAAIATVGGQILSMFFAIYIIVRKEHAVQIHFKGFRFSGQIVKDIFAVGFPSIIMQSISSVMIMVLNNILIVFSQAAVAVLGIYFKLQSFIFMPVFGLGHGSMPIMGYNFGARNKKRLVHTLKLSSTISLCIMIVGLLIFQFGAKYLLMMFNASEEMMEIGISALRTISLCFPAAALGISFSNFFQAIGEGKNSLLISVLRQLFILLPAAWLISRIGTLNQVWLAFPIAEVFALIVSILLLKLTYKSKIHDVEYLAAEEE